MLKVTTFSPIRAAAMIAICGVALPSAPTQAQTYPTRPIRVILPFPTGGGADASVRVVVDRMSAKLGQPIVLEPRPGAGTAIAMQYLIAQPPDGYTLANMVNSGAIKSALPKPPFDVRKDLVPIVRLSDTPMYLAVNAEKVPSKTLKELMDHARANPGKLNFSSYGLGSLAHLTAELIMQVEGARMVSIPYNGSAANVAALVRGDSDAAIDSLGALRAQVGSGRLRLLAVSTAERSHFAPDVPGMKEAGLAGYNITAYSVLVAPVGTPRELLQRLNSVANEVLKQPEVVDFYAKLGQLTAGGSLEHTAELVNREVSLYSKIIRDGKLELE